MILLEIESPQILANLHPDFEALIPSHQGIHGVLVTAPAVENGYDYHYRFFWPWAGTNEDPVTGGVQTFLAKYWSKKLNKKNLKAFQSSGRTGYMNVPCRMKSFAYQQGSSHAGRKFYGNLICRMINTTLVPESLPYRSFYKDGFCISTVKQDWI